MTDKYTVHQRISRHIKETPYITKGVNLCRLPNGKRCMGCCGLDFAKDTTNKRPFIEGMVQSRDELKQYKDKWDYKRRVRPEDLYPCGQCKQLVVEEDGTVDELVKKKHVCFTCPLHPAQNNGKEMRVGECDTDFMCESQHAWASWDESERDAFLKFIESKNLDWFEYSKQMNNNSLLNEFLNT